MLLLAALPLAVGGTAAWADGGGSSDAYKGPEYREGTNSFGPDSVDLLQLGLNVRQELSPPFKANDLAYQVVAYYTSPGTDIKYSRDGEWEFQASDYLYLSPETIWGPMGAGWTVHMGKVLSSGAVDVTLSGMEQCGFDDDRIWPGGNFCGCTHRPGSTSSQPINDRHLFNTIVEPSGLMHPMYTQAVRCEDTNGSCSWSPDFSTDYSWIRADTDPSVCHGTKSWRTPDGTLYEVRTDGLVKKITDLSGNWVEVSYFDNLAGAGYGVTRSKLPNVWTREFEAWILRDPALPLREIRDSMGRTITFVLTAQPRGGLYRIEKIISTSPSQDRQSVYQLVYKERDIRNYLESSDILNHVPRTCGGGASGQQNCFAPEMRTTPGSDGHWLRGIPFLVQVVMPDGTTVEFDYYDWGGLKSIRTANGGLIEYQWMKWYGPWGIVSGSGIKLASRTVRPAPGSPEVYAWKFEKNPLPEPGRVFELGSVADPKIYYDRDRTIVTTPEGNEIAYRFNDFGELRNVKVYAGTAMRWNENLCGGAGGSACVSGWPSGRLLREVNRLFDQGHITGSQVFPILTNQIGQIEYKTAVPPFNDVERINTRVRQEDVIYFDDALSAPSCTSTAALWDEVTRDWWWDLRGDGILTSCSTSPVDPRIYFPYAREVNGEWQKSHGYSKKTLTGSALGYTREEKRQFLTSTSPSEPLVCDAALCNSIYCNAVSTCTTQPANCCCDNPANYCIAADSPYRLYKDLWFRSPIAWVKTTERKQVGAQTVVTGTTLAEYEYDRQQIHKVVKEIHRKKPGSVVPSDYPYDPHSPGTNGDVNVTYELFDKRDPAAAAGPGTHGLARKVTRNGGDPRSLDPNATGDSQVTYEETFDYLYGTPISRQFTGVAWVAWKSLDVPVLKVTLSGHVEESRDPAGVATAFQYDSMGRVVRTERGPGSGEYPEHLEVLYDYPATSDPAHVPLKKIKGLVTWTGPDGASRETSASATYLLTDIDGLSRKWREERKLADASKVERVLQYGFPRNDGSGLFAAWDRVREESEWVPACQSCTRPGTTYSVKLESTELAVNGKFDPFLRIGRETTADAKVRILRYFGLNSRVEVQEVRGASGQVLAPNPETRYFRDHLGRLRIVDAPAGGADALYEYDIHGNLVKAKLGAQVTFPSTLSLDAGGFILDRLQATIADPEAQVRRFTFDALGRLRDAENPESGIVHYHSYDPAGNLLLSDDEEGAVLWREYDRAGRLIRLEQCPRDATGTVRCDLPRTLLGRWDYHNATETARGSSLSRLLTVYSHDDTGALVSQQDYFYLGRNGRLSEERTSLQDWSQPGAMGPLYAAEYSYGAEGQIQQITYPHPAGNSLGATVVTYGYEHGLLKTVSSNRATVDATFSYHPSGLVKEIAHGNGVKTTIEDDIRGRVESIAAGVPGSQPVWETGTHRYDGAGNIYEIGDTSLGAANYWKFGYDANQRLTWAKLKGYEITYEYDKFGNMTTRWFTTGTPPPGMQFSGRGHAGNQITDTGFSYDGNGNLRDTPAVSANDRALAYDYDARNRLTAVGPVDLSCAAPPCELDPLDLRGTYRYSASGMRLKKEDGVSDWTTFYFRDFSGQVLSEFVRPNAGGITTWNLDYVYGGGRHLALVENGPPAPPGGFVTCSETASHPCGQSGTGNAITLDWVDNADLDVYGYRVYRSNFRTSFDSGGSPQLLHEGVLGTSSFADLSGKSCPTGGSLYCWYAVKAMDRSGREGSFSTPLAFQTGDITPPGDPRLPRQDGSSTTSVTISWSPPNGNLTDLLGYYVWRKASPEDPYPLTLTWIPTQGTSITDVGLNCGLTYFYDIAAVDTASNRSLQPITNFGATTAACPPSGGGGGDGDGGKKRTGLELDPADSELVAFLNVVFSQAASPSDWIAYTMHADHLGSIRLVTNSDGHVKSKHDYFPFGKEIGPIQKTPTTHKFTGHERDVETDLDYMFARYYGSGLSRFLSVDPRGDTELESPQTSNQYAYVRNNPLAYIDPTGEFSYLVSRPFGLYESKTHMFIVTHANSPGDMGPHVNIISYGRTDAGKVGKVTDETRNIYSKGTSQTDRTSWSSLDSPSSSEVNYLRIPAPDDVVLDAANSLVENLNYDALGPNSNSASQAVANKAAGKDIGTPTDATGSDKYQMHTFKDSSSIPSDAKQSTQKLKSAAPDGVDSKSMYVHVTSRNAEYR